MRIPLGTVVHDSHEGKPWVYVGFRITTIHTESHCFVECLPNDYARIRPLHTYEATYDTALFRKFPDLLGKETISGVIEAARALITHPNQLTLFELKKAIDAYKEFIGRP